MEVLLLPTEYSVQKMVKIPLTKNGKAVGKVWKALQNVDAFAFLDELSGGHKPKVEVCGALGEGQTVWILARLPTIVFDGVDTVHKYMLITNTHDGTGSVRILPTPIRVFVQYFVAWLLNKRQVKVMQLDIRVRCTKEWKKHYRL